MPYLYVFQSTLPRGERRVLLLLSFLSLSISIHAPTRGATTGQLRHSILSLYFNPRSHEGSDSDKTRVLLCNAGISIHAPTRGATQVTDSPPSAAFDFNPRSHEGSDQNQTLHRCFHCLFQSTLPRGERLFHLIQ